MNDFVDPATFGNADASYRAAGGIEGIGRLVAAFYHHMDSLPEAAGIRAMHAADLEESRKKLTYFLSGWLGGPKLYREHYGSIIIPTAHRHLSIGYAERDSWLRCMQLAIDEQPYSAAFKQYLFKQLSIPAEFTRKACEQAQSAQSAC